MRRHLKMNNVIPYTGFEIPTQLLLDNPNKEMIEFTVEIKKDFKTLRDRLIFIQNSKRLKYLCDMNHIPFREIDGYDRWWIKVTKDPLEIGPEEETEVRDTTYTEVEPWYKRFFNFVKDVFK